MAAIIKNLGDGVGDAVNGITNGVANAGKDIVPGLSLPIPKVSLPTLIPGSGGNTNSSAAASNSATDIPTPSNSSTPISNSASAIPSNSTALPVPSITPSANITLPTQAQDNGSNGGNSTVFFTNTVTSQNAAVTHSSAPQAPKSFLQNKPLAGAVLGLAGLVGLVLIFVITTWAMRRRRKSRLMDEAISFEPTAHHSYAEDMERLNEKASVSDVYVAPYGGTAPAPTQGYYNHPGAGGYPQFTLPSQSGY